MPLEDFKDRHVGEPCFIVGSGPSVNDRDLSVLRGRVTFSCNRGWRLFERFGFQTTYWAVEDPLDVRQFKTEFERLTGPVKFIADDLGDLSGAIRVPFVRDHTDGYPKFSTEPPFYFGGTVTYLMLQLAAYMGCSVAYLLGQDFRWTTDDTRDAGEAWVIDADRNHFGSDYWPKGTLAFRPRPERMRRAFVSANMAMRVVNLTPNSALDVFECDNLDAVVTGQADPLATQQIPLEINEFTRWLSTPLENVLEIGVFRGGSSRTWHRLSTGTVIGLDRDSWITNLEKRFPRFKAVVGSSHDAVTMGAVEALLNGALVDLLFIDGDHSLKGVNQDYGTYKRFVKPKGTIAFHDINADAGFFETWEEGGVPVFWKNLVGDKHVFSADMNWGGIGVVTA